jgi:hypothetical protein
MGFLSKLFGGASPEEKAATAAAKAEARARRKAEEQAEKAAVAEALLGQAMGLDPAHASLDARRKAAIKLVLKNQTELGREAWLSISRDYPDRAVRCARTGWGLLSPRQELPRCARKLRSGDPLGSQR